MNQVRRCVNLRSSLIKIGSNKMKKQLALFVIPVLIYLIVWTSVDMPKPIELLTLDNKGNKNIVDLDRSCSSTFVTWSIIAYVWQFLLLLSSSVLAFQFRGVRDEINESQSIGMLVYSHLMFLIFRIVCQGLSLKGSITKTAGSSIVSILLSVDVLAGTVIYFGPKFYNVMTENKDISQSGLASAGHKNSSSLTRLLRLRTQGVRAIRKKPPLESHMKTNMKTIISGPSDVHRHSKKSLPSASNSNDPPKSCKVSFKDIHQE